MQLVALNHWHRKQVFNDNFLSAQEQLAPTIETVTKKLGELGVGFVDTNEEFKSLCSRKT